MDYKVLLFDFIHNLLNLYKSCSWGYQIINFVGLKLGLIALMAATLPGMAQKPSFQVKSSAVETYDFLETTITINPKGIVNPFTDVMVVGEFTDQHQTFKVNGYCDAQDGSVYKVRFMPQSPGVFNYVIKFTANGKTYSYQNSFTALASNRQGVLQVDPEHPTHFIYSGTKKHFFWNSTTAYWMLGWQDETTIGQAIDRLAAYGINRIRVAINGRAHGGNRWNENNVVECAKFTFKLNPWVAEAPDDLDQPGFDVTRFNVAHWQKMDRLMAHARDKGIVVSFIFYVDGLDHGCDPFKKEKMGQADEQRYYAYAVARYGAYENLMWDIANEYHLFRTESWADQMGTYLKTLDVSNHLISVHGHGDFPFRQSPWVGCVLYQSWDECGGYDFMMNNQHAQAQTGRPLPQINEEYGYEGHYAVWGCGAVATKEKNFRAGLFRSQLAWEICMSGSYQTTGETAEFGTGAAEDSGGGWINGRGNDQMTMLRYYQILKNCFEQTRFWLMKPDPQAVNSGNLCLSIPDQDYLLYTRLHYARIRLKKGDRYAVKMINPRTGEETILPDANTTDWSWQYPKELTEPMVFILKRK